MKNIKRASKWILLVILSFNLFFISLIFYSEIKYFPPPTEVNQNLNLYDSTLGRYYIDFSKNKFLGDSELDINSIPILKINGEFFYHPVYISQFALGAYDYYLKTKNKDARNKFIQCAHWLKDNLKKHDQFYLWEYNFDSDFSGRIYKLPWFSAMAQGQGASVLLRAYNETDEEEFLAVARKAITPIFYDLNEGGLSIVKGTYYIFPQEFPTNPPSDILNGAIYAFFGIYDYYRITGDSTIKQNCEIILNTFSEVIADYDVNNWSLYCRWPGYLATPHYQADHIAQLSILYQISGNQKFLEYAYKFDRYQKNWTNRANYFLSTHIRQLKEFSLGDIKKVPEFIKETLIP